TSDLWRKISIYVCIPALLIAGVNAYNLYSAHQEHVAHLAEHPEEDHPEYPYQNIRTKNVNAPFYGDGDKTLFWNDAVNQHKES
ncbi:cytochrome c oxidase, subunit VIa, partial [Protomyces lactucae-debilis]